MYIYIYIYMYVHDSAKLISLPVQFIQDGD